MKEVHTGTTGNHRLKSLKNHSEDSDILQVLARRKECIDAKIARYNEALEKIELFMKTTKQYNLNESNGTVLEKTIDDMIFAGHRYKGRYQDMGKALSIVGRAMGRFISGPAMSLDYDGEYVEDSADIEAGFQVSGNIKRKGVESRVLKGGKDVTIMHYGPYETLGRSYTEAFSHINEKKYKILVPCRVLYHKGPGMIFRGNPEKYITEIQIFVE
jgi:effector-binding domain-containing protein